MSSSRGRGDRKHDLAASRELPREVSAGKAGREYQVHTYPTKVPPQAIEPFLLASSEPGGLVLDPFCGSGMTGVAARATGRRALLSDLSPGAVHLASNHNTFVDPRRLLVEATRIVGEARNLAETLYNTRCPTCRAKDQLLRHVVWSETRRCPAGHVVVLWDQISDATGSVAKHLDCGQCGQQVARAGATSGASVAVEKTVDCGNCRHLQRGPLDSADRARLTRFDGMPVEAWVPDVPLGPDREMYRRSALHLRGIKNVSDFYMPRPKLALADLWARIGSVTDASLRGGLRFAFTNTAWHSTRMRRYNAAGGQRPMTGTLYIPQLVAEPNVYTVFLNQIQQLARFYGGFEPSPPAVEARVGNATDLSWLPNDCVDYVFTDPPFGANIYYADCNVVWEAWLGNVAAVEDEILVNRSLPVSSGGKTLDDYEHLLTRAFAEMQRVSRSSARCTVVFHNSDDAVWTAMLSAAEAGGLRQAGVTIVDKVQRSMKGYRGRSGAELVPFYDLAITFDQSPTSPRIELEAVAIAQNAVAKHLGGPHAIDPQHRTLEYLYSLSVGSVITSGAALAGLSFRAFEGLLNEKFARHGQTYEIVGG